MIGQFVRDSTVPAVSNLKDRMLLIFIVGWVYLKKIKIKKMHLELNNWTVCGPELLLSVFAIRKVDELTESDPYFTKLLSQSRLPPASSCREYFRVL